jgi:quinol monooxygenase YgiN/predicted enzyme related to lactoylglutathione lyase
MLIQSVHFTFTPEDADKAEALFRELRVASLKEPGVVGFDVARSHDKPGVFVLWEQYRDRAAFDAHVASEHYQRLVINGVRPLSRDRAGEIAFPIADTVQVGQKTYEIPPREGYTVAQFLTVADRERSARFYEKIFDGHILTMGDDKGAPVFIQIANTWLILYFGGGPTPDKPTVTLSLPDPNNISSFMNLRVADIQACYELFRSRGAEFITEPKDKYGETRCYIRDPDGYIIEIGQSKPGYPVA